MVWLRMGPKSMGLGFLRLHAKFQLNLTCLGLVIARVGRSGSYRIGSRSRVLDRIGLKLNFPIRLSDPGHEVSGKVHYGIGPSIQTVTVRSLKF